MTVPSGYDARSTSQFFASSLNASKGPSNAGRARSSFGKCVMAYSLGSFPGIAMRSGLNEEHGAGEARHDQPEVLRNTKENRRLGTDRTPQNRDDKRTSRIRRDQEREHAESKDRRRARQPESRH